MRLLHCMSMEIVMGQHRLCLVGVCLLSIVPVPGAGISGTFRGYVNPLRHYDVKSGSVFAYNLSDGETTDELLVLVKDFLERKDEILSTVSHLSRHRVGTERCDTTVSTQNLRPHIEELQAAGLELTRRYVNVGASDGMNDDPLYEYALALNATGVAVERDEERCKLHKQHLPNVDVVCSEVTPQNAVGLIGGLVDIDILKVDIDSYDCPVLEALLEATTPRLVLVEANPSIPPPYQWAMLHHTGLWPFFWGFHAPEAVPIRGCSLAYEVDLLKRFGFDFVAFGGHDALFAHRSLRELWLPRKLPMDEFDCFNEAFIAANGIPIDKTRRWFF